MGRPAGWMMALTGRSSMKSPGAPSLRREVEREFWREVAKGLLPEDAAAVVGVSPAAGTRWFRQGGGMPTIDLSPLTGRYLSFAEREELALLKAQGFGIREIAGRLGRSPSTISREPRRNAATRGGSKGRPRAARIPAAADVDIGEPHISRQNLDQCLAATRRGQVILDNLQDLGPSEPSYHDMPVLHDVTSQAPDACDETPSRRARPEQAPSKVLNRIRTPAGSAAPITLGFPAELWRFNMTSRFRARPSPVGTC